MAVLKFSRSLNCPKFMPALGDAVMAIVVPKGSHGAYREQIVLDARSVVRAPVGKTHPEAATLPMNGLTARLSLDLLKLSPGQVIAVTGAAGAYGGYVIQLAKAEGLTVIADASEKDEKLVARLPRSSTAIAFCRHERAAWPWPGPRLRSVLS